MNSSEKERLKLEMNRKANHIERPSNLSNFVYPTEEELLTEADFKNTPSYLQNLNVLADWISKDLSYRQRNQLNKNCEFLVGSFDSKFPLDESTIACAAWWIEKRNVLYSQEQKIKAFNENSSVKMTSSQKKNWLNFQYLSLNQAIPLIDLENNSEQYYTKEALYYADDCTLKNANAALLLKLENFLPNPQTYANIEKIYTKIEGCLVPNEEPSETTHLRMGLLRLLQGKTDLAFTALKKTQLEKEPKENSRSLFWLGTIYKKNNPAQKTNPYWQQLIKENPLSLSALVANQQMGVDPMSVLVSDDSILLQNRAEGGWSKENLEAFIFDVLLATKKNDAAIAWANYVSKTMTTTNPNLILYWVLTQNKLHNYYSSIQLFSRYTRYQKNYLASRGLLNLQFPTPYLREIVSVKSLVDPIFTLALMRQESAFDENARSFANARGLMQVLPNTAKTVRRSVRPNDLYNPDTNIELGDALLEKLFRKYDGKSEYVLASYNAGPANLDKWLTRIPSENTMLFSDFIPFKETRNYVSIILRNYYWYSIILSENENKFAQHVLERSQNSRFKSERVQALLASISEKTSLTELQRNLLNRIYIFGEEGRLNALSMNLLSEKNAKDSGL
ncbi:MAG: lytic transglycosylase domain-containing protein [Bdellovibrionota bacterium]